jgi:hypothetical protein
MNFLRKCVEIALLTIKMALLKSRVSIKQSNHVVKSGSFCTRTMKVHSYFILKLGQIIKQVK